MQVESQVFKIEISIEVGDDTVSVQKHIVKYRDTETKAGQELVYLCEAAEALGLDILEADYTQIEPEESGD